ncbi:hypothetical protein LTR10_019845 [Elasticomyces elasticus]|uniref:RanBD1 domain-containing protein n=1 Tax=Exophiala sideris TaxID=1016849 RepID=A0ABR0J1R6_9EURO|nr:hypothetical protein LTR10_019845 [Elasticomyces elasticus]KAK5024429.1 hypothetical protein LTS07_008720 [Exophiala sideris]KAK5030889.1 hypothetical protein LTR13_007902 [Exophiala sideris]KAK5054162.1 hypothetical protein LTR69_009124 [Exophiala sideris]KAK5179482.1 hypothetical protein LTR44_007998 [Eurotiomycetes sp. CCFEE 6388]
MPTEAEPTNSTGDTHQEDGTLPQDQSSDGEGGERTAREKLRTTTIEQVTEANNASSNIESHVEVGTRGRPSKKRSFEDLQTEDLTPDVENGGLPLPKKGLHKRMRSREVSGSDEVQGLETRDGATSPVQEESDADAQKAPGGPGILVSAAPKDGTDATEEDTKDDSAFADVSSASTEKPGLESDKTDALAATKEQPAKTETPSSSGFANTAAASPFSSFKPSKSPSKELEPTPAPEKSTSTSTSAFASSGLSSFASSDKSPFASSTTKPSGGFGGGGGLGGFGSASSAFGGPSPFASKPSSGFGSGGGFGSSGGLGSGFGPSKPFSGGSTSFAGPAGSTGTFGKAKPFASTSDDHEEGSENEADGEEGHSSAVDAPRDLRFKEQEVETGEEGEETILTCRAKLYHFEKEWKERGVGVLKINIRYENRAVGDEASDEKPEDEEDEESGAQADFTGVERKARLIMRTDGVHRLVLNTPVFKDMNVGTHDGQEPSGKTMHLTGLEEGKPTGYQIKVGKEDTLREIYYKIMELKEEL